jgi:hypothetical protein
MSIPWTPSQFLKERRHEFPMMDFDLAIRPNNQISVKKRRATISYFLGNPERDGDVMFFCGSTDGSYFFSVDVHGILHHASEEGVGLRWG